MLADRRPQVGNARPGPVFLAGADRSGKTLVRWMLSSLPNLVVTRRTELWPRYYRRFGDLADPRNLDRCLDSMLMRKQVAALDPDPERLCRDFREGPLTYPRLFALLHEHYAQRCGKARWGDQTGSIDRFADEVIAAYPGAKIVHLIRDPRDAYEAVLQRGERSRGTVGSYAGRWMTSTALARRNSARHPNFYRVVAYEALVTRPEETMRTICAFIDESFNPSMLLLEGIRRYQPQRVEAGGGSPISAGYVGRFRDSLAPRDVAFIQGVAGRRMDAFDYPTERVRLTILERLVGGAAEWPPALARMGGRRLLEGLDDLRLATMSRTVPR